MKVDKNIFNSVMSKRPSVNQIVEFLKQLFVKKESTIFLTHRYRFKKCKVWVVKFMFKKACSKKLN